MIDFGLDEGDGVVDDGSGVLVTLDRVHTPIPFFSRISGIWRDLVRASSGFVPRPRSLIQFGLGTQRII